MFVLIVLCYIKMAIDKVISSLPLEFRGSDPVSTCWLSEYHDRVSHPTQTLRRNIEMVIERLMDSDGRGLKREFVCYLWLCIPVLMGYSD
jgi:hypothetical protein